MRKRHAFVALSALLLGAASAIAAPNPLAASLRVTVDGVSAAGGVLHVGVYDEATFPAIADLALFKRDISQVAGDVGLQFDRLPPGTYAVRAYQDVNNNGRWEMGEPRGISNDAAPDNFDAAAIPIRPGVNMTVIHLR